MGIYLRSLRPVQLRLITAIARHGKLRLAANECGMTTSAASRMLADIETQLGTELFARMPKGMAPTPAGGVLVKHARKIVHDLERMEQDFKAHQAGQGGSVRVGAVTGAALSILIPAILQLKKEAPLVEIMLDVSSSSRLMWGLERGEYDFALCRLSPEEPEQEFDVLPARDEAVLLMVRSGHPLAGASNVALTDLDRYPWTMQQRGAPLRHALDIAFREAGADPPPNLIETSSVVAIMALLRDSDVIAVVTQEVADLLLSPPFSADLALIATDKPIFIEPYHVLRPRDRIMTVAAQRFLTLVQKELAPGP